MTRMTQLPELAPRISFDFQRSQSMPPKLAFTRGSTATQFDWFGDLVLSPVDTPRIDFDPVTLKCRGLLMEPPDTNHVLYSKEPWNPDGGSITYDPSGKIEQGITVGKIPLAKVTMGTGSTIHSYRRLLTVFPAATSGYSYQWFLMEGTAKIACPVIQLLRVENGQTVVHARSSAVVDLRTGEIRGDYLVSSGEWVARKLANGLVHVIFRGNPLGYSATLQSYAEVRISEKQSILETNALDSVQGDGVSYIYVGGEHYSTTERNPSYIPTMDRTVTRLGEVCELFGSALGTLSEAAVYVEVESIVDSTRANVIAQLGESGTDRIYLERVTDDAFQVRINKGDAVNGPKHSGTNGVHYVAFSIKEGSLVSAVDGIPMTLHDVSVVVPALAPLILGTSKGSNNYTARGWIKKLSVYDVALTAEQLSALTSKGD